MQVAKPILGVFIEAARNPIAIPSDNCGIPRAVAMVGQFAFDLVIALFIFGVS
jgi:hypothetical protein